MKRSYTYEEREMILNFVSNAKKDPNLRRYTIARLLQLVSPPDRVPDVNTYTRWKHEGLTEMAYHQRLSRRGVSKKLTRIQEQLLIGYGCERRRNLLSVSQADLIDFASSHMNINLSKSTISRIMQRAGLSSQHSMKRETRMTTEKVVDDAINFLQDVRDYNYPPDRILVMDETGLWSNVVDSRTYHFRNGCATLTLSLFKFFAGF